MSQSHIREMRKRRMIHRDAMREPSPTSTIAGLIHCAHCDTIGVLRFGSPDSRSSRSVVCCAAEKPVDRSIPAPKPQDELKTFAADSEGAEMLRESAAERAEEFCQVCQLDGTAE